jgi:excinuclease ABC subunit A
LKHHASTEGNTEMKQIVVRGARENNLKNVDCELPRDQLVVITGLSGSGKTSLAFDTLYAEGQRRYVESLSAYARQFLDQRGKPDVDSVEGLSPAISIEQRSLSKNPRSTVGTITEIYDHLRLLYARIGAAHCPTCGRPITAQSVQQMVDLTFSMLSEGTRFSVLAPVVRGRKGAFRKELERLRKEGFARVDVDGQSCDLHEPLELDRKQRHNIDVYVDRLVLKPSVRSRLSESLELALQQADGIAKLKPQEGKVQLFSERLACVDCGVSIPELTPRSFSFNNPQGACPRCAGIGELMEFDEASVVLRPELSLREGAIEPWEHRNAAYYQQVLEALADQFRFDLYTPYAELSPSVKTLLMKGSGEIDVEFFFDKGASRHSYRKPFEGVLAGLTRRLEELEKSRKEGKGGEGGQEELHRYMRRRACPECGGARLNTEARNVFVSGRPIHSVSAMSIGQALAFFESLALGQREGAIADRLLREIRGRLTFLDDVGLSYLTLDRPSATLSGGEGQRVRLATQIGASLVGVLYILDEPSVGLHQRDHGRLLESLVRLRDLGNTVLVVEHDEETIRAADYIVDMGPGAGTRGGEVVVAGTLEQVLAHPTSLTGQYLSGARCIEVPGQRRKPRGKLKLQGASQHNLVGIDAEIPLGVLTCVTGVSGSGKSTLVIDTLLPALKNLLHGSKAAVGEYDALKGDHQLDKVIAIDQGPIGRTPRSNPATYTRLFTPLRELYAAIPESKARGYKAGRFSFNVKGGRCEACQGDGTLRIEMHFLPDVFVECDVCKGRRYDRETLEVLYKGRSIADVLEMTVAEAGELLAAVPQLGAKLKTLQEVGLGYLTLGQSATTLSGGEAQRLKLSRELAKRATGRTLYILDEPTTGLHLADIHLLLEVLARLVDAGNSVLIIEHQLDVIKTADWIVDLGPEGGDGGGQIVACGTPEEVAQVEGSHTGTYLRRVLGL